MQIPRTIRPEQGKVGVGIDAEYAGIGDDALIVSQSDLL